MTLSELLDLMWKDYCDLNPQAKKIYDLLSHNGESVLNDHIALRTFQHPKMGIESLAKTFRSFGYEEKGEYFFKEKKLYAKHYQHPDLTLPKVFISELELSKTSDLIQNEVKKMIDQVPADYFDNPKSSVNGRPWVMSHQTYLKLAEQSEYASWVAAHGFRPNHFTVNVNALKKFASLETLNEFIEKNGFKLNSSGGKIKGTPEECLEQSSTLASEIEVKFTDGIFKIPGCYYEFAKRYAAADGKLYHGFIAKSADKIFESTDRQKG